MTKYEWERELKRHIAVLPKNEQARIARSSKTASRRACRKKISSMNSATPST